MSASVKIVGGDALMAALKALPEQLAHEAGGIVAGHAELMKAKVAAEYSGHVFKGNLLKGLKTTRESFGLAVVATVQSTAPHAYMFENGTVMRHWTGPRGTGKSTGRQRPANIFVPAKIRELKAMRQDLIVLVERAGLKVT